MRSLFMNPENHGIQLIQGDQDEGVAEFSFKFGDTEGSYCASESEAKRIGTWFINFAKEIKKETAARKKARG